MSLPELDGHHQPDEAPFLQVLGKIAASWERRAQVKQRGRPAIDFDPELPDFLPTLLPFHEHPSFARLSDERTSRLLTYGWLAYNQKAIDIERNVLVPACTELLDDAITRDEGVTADVIAQALVDESYHILLVRQANALTMKRRQLASVRFPQCNIIQRMRTRQDTLAEEERGLVVIGAAIVTEVFIKGYLGRLCSAEGIQPLSLVTTKAHLADETVHASVFRLIGEILYHRLPAAQREIFADILIEAMAWFADPEWETWQAACELVGVSGTREMIQDCRRAAADPVDYDELAQFLRAVGVQGVDKRIERAQQQYRIE
ncbi:MAG: hypothetical protein Tsb0020_08310 [Haliangiales bacterium]